MIALFVLATAQSSYAAKAPYQPDADRFPAKTERYGAHLTERYLHLWLQVGPKVAGANLIIAGAPRTRVVASADRLDRWLHPPEPVAVASVVSAPAPATTSVATGAGGSTVQCESGGNYAANTGNGYYGGWQFDSGTWDAYGDPAYGEASDAPPAVQDAAAASVPYDAWPSC